MAQAQGAGGAIHSWGGEEILEGFLKKVTLTQGCEGCGVCVKWLPISEDSELVDQGIDLEAAAGMIPDVGRGIHQSGWGSTPELHQESPWAGASRGPKGPWREAKVSEVGSGYLPKTGNISVF